MPARLEDPPDGAYEVVVDIVPIDEWSEQHDVRAHIPTRSSSVSYADVATAHGFEVRAGQARFRDPHTLVVDGRVLRAGAYLVAAGAEPAIPDLPGPDQVEYLTSTTAMELTEQPQSLMVIGGGYVGTEQAQRLRHVFADDGVTVVEEHASRVESADGEVAVITSSGRRATSGRLLVTTGRRARTDGLDVHAAGIEVDERGFVVIDALGIDGAPAEVDYTEMPQVMFTRPQLASAGITEALAHGYQCECRVLDSADVPRALVNRDTRGAIKLLADARTGKVLGVHALADGAGEIMFAATYAINAGMTVNDLATTWAS